MRKTISLEIEFKGDGAVVAKRPGHFLGGVAEPNLSRGDLAFSLVRESEDEESIVPFEAVAGLFQVNLYGNSRGYRELAKYFLGLAELDTGTDPDHHDHFDRLESGDGAVMVNLIVHKAAEKS